MSQFGGWDVDEVKHNLRVLLDESHYHLGIIYYNSPIEIFSYKKNQSEFKKVLQNNDYDIIHSHICELSPILLAVAKKLNISVRIIHSRHASLPINLKTLYKNICKKFIPSTGSHFLTVSDKAGYWLFLITIHKIVIILLLK